MRRIVLAGASALALAPAAAHAGTCTGNALVTLDGGAITNVEWPRRSASELAGRVVSNATLETTYTLALRDDASVATATVSAHADGDPAKAEARQIPSGAVFWADRMPSSLEQVVLRARAIAGAAGPATVTVPLAAASKMVPATAQVERIDANDFALTVGPRHYDVIVDDRGCMIAATLAGFGLTFERRELAPEAYPLVGRYAAPAGAKYTATDVAIAAPQGHTLAGTLTRPDGKGRVPAVVMITGISKHERNEGNPPFTPFRDVADVLGRAGIAVLRVDDRGAGKSTGDFDKATSFDEADDVRTELAWLRKQPGINPKRVGLVGHSEGAFIALVVASTDPTLAAIVLLAGSGVPGEQLNTWQTINTVTHDPSVPASQRDAEIAKELADRHDWSPRDVAFVAAESGGLREEGHGAGADASGRDRPARAAALGGAARRGDARRRQHGRVRAHAAGGEPHAVPGQRRQPAGVAVAAELAAVERAARRRDGVADREARRREDVITRRRRRASTDPRATGGAGTCARAACAAPDSASPRIRGGPS